MSKHISKRDLTRAQRAMPPTINAGGPPALPGKNCSQILHARVLTGLGDTDWGWEEAPVPSGSARTSGLVGLTGDPAVATCSESCFVLAKFERKPSKSSWEFSLEPVFLLLLLLLFLFFFLLFLLALHL